jgi:isopenicillin-N N-acyltransferase-like protein
MRMQIAMFPEIEVSGAPFDRGVMYGRAARSRIERSVNLYADAVRELGLSASQMQEIVGRFLPIVEAFDAAYVEEMRGIAKGAERELIDIVIVNARTELLQLAKREAARRVPDKDGCTGVVVLPGRSATGKLIHAQNWDWRAECVDTGIVLRIRRDDGPDILTFTEAGGLARSGFNAAGVALTANYLECDRDYREIGTPLPFIRRKALEAEHVALAMRAVATTPKSASNNMMISHASGYAIDFECVPDEAFWLEPEDDLLVHANHWVSPAARARVRETGLSTVPESLYRDRRVRESLASPAGLRASDVKNALFDDWQSPYSVCRPPRQALTSNMIAATVAMIVMTPADGVMEIAPLPSENRQFASYLLKMDSSAQRLVA